MCIYETGFLVVKPLVLKTGSLENFNIMPYDIK